jgi:hypothetical protein
MRRMFIGAGAVALALVTGAGAAQATAPVWNVAQTTKLAGDDVLGDVTVAPTGSTWAVGHQFSGGQMRPVVQHLIDGTWHAVTVPSSWTMPLGVVDASSSKNVWAFGEDGSVVRWNGMKWTSAKFSSFRASDAEAISASNVWAVGGRTARHWNGRTWTKVTLPAAATSIAAVSSTSVWAAGELGESAAVMHWDGSSWKLVKTMALAKPEPDAATYFTDVAVSGRHVWAIGTQSWACGIDGDNVCYRPLALRLSGQKWTSFVGPQNAPGGYTHATADGVGGLWIVQGSWNGRLAHVVGNSLTFTTPPHPTGHDISVDALENRPGTKTVWAVGGSYPQGDPDDPTADGLYLHTG